MRVNPDIKNGILILELWLSPLSSSTAPRYPSAVGVVPISREVCQIGKMNERLCGDV